MRPDTKIQELYDHVFGGRFLVGLGRMLSRHHQTELSSSGISDDIGRFYIWNTNTYLLCTKFEDGWSFSHPKTRETAGRVLGHCS